MDAWNFPHVFNFWDQQAGAINANARRLDALGAPEREAACRRIREAVGAHAQALDDEWLLKMALTLTDDLYKYVNDEILLCPGLFDYLGAFGRAFLGAVRARGYAVHSVVDNQFSGVDFLRLGPFDLFPRVFGAAGFVYVCPQHAAWQLMQADGLAADAYPANIARYQTEARMLADRLAGECQAEGRHYLFLEADFEEGALDAALRSRGAPGVLSVFRNEAPAADSRVSADFPAQRLG